MDKFVKRKRTENQKNESEEELSLKKIKLNKTGSDLLSNITSQRTSFCSSVLNFTFNKKRVKVISEVQDVPEGCKGVVYWISRDQRVQGNNQF